MPDPEPDPPARKVVVVRRDDYEPEPDTDGLPRPPRVLVWFRVYCLLMAVVALVFTVVVAVNLYSPSWADKLRWAAGFAAVFAAYSVPLWWQRPRWWHWVYGLCLLLPGVLPFTNPVSVALLVFWFRRSTVAHFRDPAAGYTARPQPTATDAAPREEPAVLFYLRWLCLLGCGVCLLGVPLSAAAARFDPQAGWGWLPWVGGFAVGFGLFVVPLFARTPRPWVWWYGLGLLVLCSLSLYFTLLAVPVLAVWLTRLPREYFAGRSAVPLAV